MNKSQLVDALADRLGDRRTAANAVDSLLQIVVDTVRAGDSVSLAGFGVFEGRARAARVGRNPRTGQTVDVPATTVPAFRPGTGFRNAVAGGQGSAADPPAPGPRRRASASATSSNGASGETVSTAVNGAVDVEPPDTATVLTDAAALASKGKKKAAKKAADDDVKPKKKGKKGKK